MNTNRTWRVSAFSWRSTTRSASGSIRVDSCHSCSAVTVPLGGAQLDPSRVRLVFIGLIPVSSEQLLFPTGDATDDDLADRVCTLIPPARRITLRRLQPVRHRQPCLLY